MMTKAFQSPAELNLLLILILIITFIFYLNLENKATAAYNESVRQEQADKLFKANHPSVPELSFGFSHCYTTPYWFLLYALQFFTNPLSFFLLRANKFGSFLTSLIFTTLTFYCFSVWIFSTCSFLSFEDSSILMKDKSFNEFFLWGSTRLDFFLFLAVLILFICQIFILLRFVAGKFQAKLSLG